MTLVPEQLTELDAALTSAAADSQTLAAIRQLAPGLMVTRCDAIDMREETPFRVYERLSLYLVDGRDHCWKITQDPAFATGVAIAPNGGAA
jgi:hypothetical protein